MKFLLSFVLLYFSASVLAQNQSVSGCVKDSKTGQVLPFCNVHQLHSLSGVSSDHHGKFTLTIAEREDPILLLISYIGYKTDTVTVLSGEKINLIFLQPDVLNLNEIVVTGVSKATLVKENPIAILSISMRNIEKTNESNIMDVLVKHAPGLNAVKTGPNISKPFIRGLGYNRVLTLYDGVRQEGQQWGDEHGIEVDAYNITKAEVIKGPASLMYGSDALAGVVSLMPYIPNEKDSVIRGKVFSEYQSNNQLIGNGFRLGASSAHWLWALKGSKRIAKNYNNSVDGRVYNTGFQENNAAGLIGYTTNKGYSHVNVTLYDNLQGIPDGSRDSLSRKFTKQIYESNSDQIKNRPLVTEEELSSYALSPLHQHIQHYRIYNNNHYQVGKGDLDASLAFQQNVRREYNHPTQPEQAGMFVRLNTINYSLRYTMATFQNIETTFGINGMLQNNKNKNATDFPIPDYTLMDLGAYGFAKWKQKQWTLSGGLRYDMRYVNNTDFYVKKNPITGFNQQASDSTGAKLQFPAFHQTFGGLSLSFGATYKFSQRMSLKANVARGYRAPNISEIASNGLDPGAHIVYIGNKNFVPEFSFQQDLGLIGDFKDVSFSLSLFNNNIQHYIYLSQLADEQGKPIVIVPGNKTFQYQQASAHLYGAEATLNIHPEKLKGFVFYTHFSNVYGFNTKKEFTNTGIQGEYLPFIPPLKLLSGLQQSIQTNRKLISAFELKLELEYNSAQNRYLALYQTETPTPAYSLVNAGIILDVHYSKKNTLQLMFQVNNLLDVAYQSNLSRLKYFEDYAQSPKGRYGIYGMGRNVCIKLILPF